MALSVVPSSKNLRKLQSRKSHSWWWDSHISSKNSKWLAENLDEMDKSVKRMLKLIEEDADSFAKKAEMYYQRRPELISLVEEFYRMYRSLAERYDHVTGELRKNIPSDLQSQGSGVSDVLSDVPSAWPSPGPDQKLTRRKSGPRAAGFEFFLGSGGSSSDLCQKEGDESSTLTDYESESDDSSVNNYLGLFGNGGDQGITRKMIDFENELRETKEKLQMRVGENGDGLSRGTRNENFEDVLARNARYEQELKMVNDRLQSSEEEISRLNSELQRCRSSEVIDRGEVSVSNDSIQVLEELRITKEKLRGSEKEIGSLGNQLSSANKEISSLKSKLNSEKKEVSKLQERIARLKTSLSDRDYEIRELKTAVSDAEQKIFPEKAQIKAEILKLREGRRSLDEQIREWESRGRALEDEIRMLQVEKMETEKRLYYEIEELKADVADRDHRIFNLDRTIAALGREVDALKAEVTCRDDRISEMDKQLQQLRVEHDEARKQVDGMASKAKGLEEEVERQRNLILETAEEKREAIRQLCFSLEHYRDGYHMLRQAFVGHKRVPVLAA